MLEETGAVAVDKDRIVSQSAVRDNVSALSARQHASLPGRRCRKAVSRKYINKSRQCLRKSGCTLRCMKTSAGTQIRNVFPCNYCEATVHGYTRHLRQCHFDQPEVAAILKQRGKEQKLQFDVHYITLHYITVFSARPTTTRVGLTVQMSAMMLKTRSVKIKSRQVEVKKVSLKPATKSCDTIYSPQ